GARVRLVRERPRRPSRPRRMISYGQAVVLGLLQGVSELFPVSSLGHSVILPQLLGWHIHQNDSFFLTFLVATHLATALVLLGFFWHDWVRILRGLGRSIRDREIADDDTDAKLAWLLVIGTIPAGILGLLLEHPLRHAFASGKSAAVFLVLNGLMLYGAERLRRRAPEPEKGDPDARIARRLGWKEAFGVGTVQAVGRVDGRRAPGRAVERGRRPLCLPARDADHRRRRGAEAAGPARLPGQRAARARGRRRPLLRGRGVARSRRPVTGC